MFYTYRKLTPEEKKKLNPKEFYPGAIGFGETKQDAEFAYTANGGSDYARMPNGEKRKIETITTHKRDTPFDVVDTVRQQAVQSHYPW